MELILEYVVKIVWSACRFLFWRNSQSYAQNSVEFSHYFVIIQCNEKSRTQSRILYGGVALALNCYHWVQLDKAKKLQIWNCFLLQILFPHFHSSIESIERICSHFCHESPCLFWVNGNGQEVGKLGVRSGKGKWVKGQENPIHLLSCPSNVMDCYLICTPILSCPHLEEQQHQSGNHCIQSRDQRGLQADPLHPDPLGQCRLVLSQHQHWPVLSVTGMPYDAFVTLSASTENPGLGP